MEKNPLIDVRRFGTDDITTRPFTPTPAGDAMNQPSVVQVQPQTPSDPLYRRFTKKLYTLASTQPGTAIHCGAFCTVQIISDRPLTLRINDSSRPIALVDPLEITGNIDRIWLQRDYTTDETGEVTVLVSSPQWGMRFLDPEPYRRHRQSFTNAGVNSGTPWSAAADEVDPVIGITLPENGAASHYLFELTLVRCAARNGLFDETVAGSRVGTGVIYGVKIYPSDAGTVTDTYNDWLQTPSGVYHRKFDQPLKISNDYNIAVYGSAEGSDEYVSYILNVGNSY